MTSSTILRFRSLWLLAAFFLGVLLIAGPAYGVGNPKRFGDDDPDQPWHIEADHIEYNDATRQYTARGNVTIIKGDKRLAADYVRFNSQTMQAQAEGRVVLTAGEDAINGNSMILDLESETGVVYDGTVFFKENHFYIRGREIRKTGRRTFTAERAVITTCDGDRPLWKVTSRNLRVTLEGYGVASHTALQIKNIPVLYFPYFVFPAKRERQSGLLSPRFGSSDRRGNEYFQPLYWAINQSADATAYVHHMSRRGTQLGLEYRYVLDSHSRGTLMVDLLEDSKVDDGTPESSQDWGYTHDATPRSNSDRYWFRSKHDQRLPLGFRGKLDLDIVSDQDYLIEFKERYTGYIPTESYFYREFGRTFDDYNDPVRVNRFTVSKNWTEFNLNAEARWYDDVVARRGGGADDTLQRLPLIDLFALRQPVPLTPLYFDMNARYDHLYRQDGPRGHRVYATPRVYFPWRLKEHAVFEPSVGFRGAAWQLEDGENPSAREEKGFHRGVYEVRADLFSEFFRVYPFNIGNFHRVKHALRPRVLYEYIPEKDQNRHPDFDEIDRVQGKNLLSYSITNTLISKAEQTGAAGRRSSIATGPVTEGGNTGRSEHRQICRFMLQQSYDIKEAREDEPSKWRDPDRQKPFSPVYGELELRPTDAFSLQADGQWSPYDNTMKSHNVALTVQDGRGDHLFLEHRFEKDSSESIYSRFRFLFSEGIATYGDYEKNLRTGERLRLGIGLMVEFQCWSIDFGFVDEVGDRSYTVNVTLRGLGGAGSQF